MSPCSLPSRFLAPCFLCPCSLVLFFTSHCSLPNHFLPHLFLFLCALAPRHLFPHLLAPCFFLFPLDTSEGGVRYTNKPILRFSMTRLMPDLADFRSVSFAGPLPISFSQFFLAPCFLSLCFLSPSFYLFPPGPIAYCPLPSCLPFPVSLFPVSSPHLISSPPVSLLLSFPFLSRYSCLSPFLCFS
jgi:hypothetical protein